MKRGRRSARRRPPRLPDDDDILAEILLRLPPQPSSLPRAGVVCKRWRRIVTDPHFVRRFRARHGTPPVLGFFRPSCRFFNAHDQEPPNRVPASRFYLRRWCRRHTRRGSWSLMIGSRHGLVLYGFFNKLEFFSEFMVVDPMSGHRSLVVNPHGHPHTTLITAVVVSLAGGVDRRSFRLVMLSSHDYQPRVTASVYSSESGVWNCSVATLVLPLAYSYFIYHPSTLVGDAVYWLLDEGLIIQFDLETHTLAIIKQPPAADAGFGFADKNRHVVTAEDDGHLGFAVLSEFSIQLWEREIEINDDAAEWVLRKTIQLEKVLSMELKEEHLKCLWIAGFSEESDVIFINTHCGVFTIHLESMQVRKVHRRGLFHIHPYSSF
ncbi:hypothetical protein BAE44_0005562 [Dichanthelium oligosanthes]|uniref:Uncharacterized protein n=1 Tax=Dichanthelium oligosanthes TaxID=888268 RepID=A0A1E5W7M3_9POAL|nr:hypothetical protein BAE44_0005562 [Dichanthelium oligosanthes]